MKKVFAILLALSAISVVVSGCSGGGDDAATTPDATKPADDATKTE